MNIGAQRLKRIRSGEDIGQVLQDFFDDQVDPEYVDNLADLCEMGGWPDEDSDPQYQVKRVVCEGSFCQLTAEVFFDEKVYGGGCADMPTIESRFGDVEFQLNLDTGEIEWQPDV